MDIDTALIQEPYARKKPNCNSLYIPNVPEAFTIFHQLSGDHAFRAVIVAKSKLGPTLADIVCENFAVGVTCHTFEQKITFLSLYCRPAVRSLESHLAIVSSVKQELLKHCVIAVDANAHSPTWSSGRLDSRGRELEIFLSNQNLSIFNILNSELDYYPRNSSIVDVTLGGDEIQIRDWRFFPIDSLSDHPFIYFEVLGNKACGSRKVKRVPKMAQVDGNVFLTQLAAKLMSIPTNLTLDNEHATSVNVIDYAIQVLTEAVVISLQKSEIKQMGKSVSKLEWWNNELWGLRHKLRSALKK